MSSYYTYGSMPQEVWPARNQAPPSQAQQDHDSILFPSDEHTEAYADGGDVEDSGDMLPLDAINQPPGQDGGEFVAGDSNGRADDIDAKLSPGEYVIDAETVALLGDGNSEAGARALDLMREEIRRHKGGALVKGQISPPARTPLEYLHAAGALGASGDGDGDEAAPPVDDQDDMGDE